MRFTAYYNLAELGSQACADTGGGGGVRGAVTTVTDCESAAAALGLNDTTVDELDVIYSDARSAGCHWYSDSFTKILGFNTNLESVENCANCQCNDCILPVCRLYTAKELFDAALAQARETEAATYETFYTASIVLVIFIEAAGILSVLKSTKEVRWPQAVLVIIFGIRSFDMFSDWVRSPPPLSTRPSLTLSACPSSALLGQGSWALWSA